MKILGAVLGSVVIGAQVALAASPPACVLSVDGNGVAQVQVSQGDAPGVTGLCTALTQALADRPALTDALARHQAQIALHAQTVTPNRMAVNLVLHSGGQHAQGNPLALDQIDGGPPGFDATSLNQLARHLLDAPPFAAFSQTP